MLLNPQCGASNIELIENLERSRNIFDSLSNGVSISDLRLPDSPLIYVNPAFERMTGYSAGEVIGRNCRFLQGLDRDQPGLTQMREALRTGNSVRVKLKNYRKDGSLFWNELFLSPVAPADHPTHYLGIQNDISELEAALEAKREAAQKNMEADIFLRGAGEGIYALDAEGLTTFVNPAAEAMLGWKTEELLGRSQHAMIHHSHADRTENIRARCPICTSLRAGLISRVEDEVFWRKNGSSFPVEYTVSPILREGAPGGAVVLFQDITERKRREKADLATSQAKTDFLSNMSHEIRTPMNGIQGMIQLLLASELTKDQRHYAEVAESSGRTLLALIDDILDVAKIEAGKTVIEALDFNLHRTLTDVAEMWKIQAETKGLAFHVDLPPEIGGQLCGDARRLRQVLNNLISNAIKFTQSGQVLLRVQQEAPDPQAPDPQAPDPQAPDPQDGDPQKQNQQAGQQGRAVLRFSIVDTGLGLRADQIEILFQPFVQADISTTRKYGGSGLGLTICKHLVTLMGGQIGIISREGEGCTFWFTVPFERGQAAAVDAPSGLASQTHSCVPRESAGDEALAQQQRILVVEDNATNRMVVMAQLKKLGYQSETVEDGQQCLDALARGSYGLILMDCEMPVMDGYEATRRIRQLEAAQPGAPRIPILALTAHAMSGHREQCRQAGMDYFLSKPLDMHRLGRTLQQWCRTVLPADASAAGPAIAPDAAIPALDAGSMARQATVDDGSGCFALREPGTGSGLSVADDGDHPCHQEQAMLEDAAIASGATEPEFRAAEEEVVFDPIALMQRLMQDRQIARVIIDGFLGDCPAQLDSLRRQFSEANLPAVRLQAHALRGSAAAVSAVQLSAVAMQMENSATGTTLDDCARLLPRAVHAFEQFKDTLRTSGWL